MGLRPPDVSENPDRLFARSVRSGAAAFARRHDGLGATGLPVGPRIIRAPTPAFRRAAGAGPGVHARSKNEQALRSDDLSDSSTGPAGGR